MALLEIRLLYQYQYRPGVFPVPRLPLIQQDKYGLGSDRNSEGSA